MKKALRETQTLHDGCRQSQKNFTPLQTPFPGARDGQNLISWRWSLPSPINPVWWRSMHAISSYHGNRPTNKHTHPQTELITIHCTAASAQCWYPHESLVEAGRASNQSWSPVKVLHILIWSPPASCYWKHLQIMATWF